MIYITSFITGILLSLGLGISGMTSPQKVFSFFNIFGNWDPTLFFVVIAAIGTHMILYRFIIRKASPLFAAKFMVPAKGRIDTKLISGAFLFGLGWGMTGLCPAPAITALITTHSSALVFLVSMTTGIYVTRSFMK